MTNFKFLAIGSIFFLLFLYIFVTFSVSKSEQKEDFSIFLFISNKTEIEEAKIKEAEEIVKKIKDAYNKNLYEKVTELLKDLPSDFSLTPEENLIVSESFLRSGYPEKAIEFSEKVISVKKGTKEACIANIIKIKAFIIKGDYKEAKKKIKDFLDSYCESTFKNEANVLLHFIKELPSEEFEKLEKNLIKRVLGELYKLRGFYFIKRGDLKKAEDDFFTYINVYGTYKEAPELIYKLADALFEKGEKEKAKTYYELIITNWDGTKEALFSKFRLYQLAYEKVLLKELLPEKTIQDLISFATLIKSKYPEEKIAEEASFMVVKVNFENKNFLSAKKSAEDFLKIYEESPLANKIKEYYCDSLSSLFKDALKKGNFSLILKSEKEDKEFLEKTNCGKAYYTLGNIYLDYSLYTKATYCFIKAYELEKNKDLIPQILVKLGLIALETDNIDLFSDIFTFLEKTNSGKVAGDPYYFYLKGFYEMQRDLKSGEYYLNLAINSSLPEILKEKLLRYFRDRAVLLRNYNKAFSYTLNPFFKATPDDYILLLLETFYTDEKLFEKILEYAKDKFPENYKIKWLEAYYLEKKGNVKTSAKLWEELTQGESLENELAKSYEKMKKLIEKTHQTVF